MADSPSPLLETKLFSPRWRPGLVSRPRLIERLERGIERKLTLVSAPAGFGKTTLLAEWLAAAPTGERAAAWVSLDQGDNDPGRFWSYVITALQTTRAGAGGHAMSLLRSPQPPPIESVLTTLINDIAALEDDLVVILDDYHVIDAEPVHGTVAFLLDHLPPRMRLIITSRSDPPLPVARLRGRGELTELRAADLRFTPDEAASFLNEAMGLGLTAGDAAVLETRTEGWIAGLQLAALSMQGREDAAGFIRAFAGDDRYIVDYLVEEVLQRQSATLRDFLLRTSILDRLSGPLCDAVTDRDDGRGMLEALERGNLFVVPLDDRRQWYRYHHLFADVLHTRLLWEQPERVAGLHRRAAEWHAQNGPQSDAIRHALAAGDVERAAVLIELAWSAMHRSYQDATWLGWVTALPEQLVRARPVLSVGHAWALLNTGELEAGEARLRDAERWLEPTSDPRGQAIAPADGMVVVDDKEFRSLPATIATARAFQAAALGDAPAAVTHARRALDLLSASEGDAFERGRAASLLGLAYWASGDLEAAYRTFADGIAHIRKAGKHQHLLTLSATYVLAEIRVTQGRLREAARTYEQALQLAADQGEPLSPATAVLRGGLSEIYRERGDLRAAAWQLLQAAEPGEHIVSREQRWLVARARLQAAQGNPDGALDLLDEAERLHSRNPVPDVRPIAALKARVWIAQGRLAEALAWARERGLSATDDLSYPREFEHITLARALIARDRSDRAARSMEEAAGLLERLLRAARAGERTGSVIEILTLQALALEAKGDTPHALAALERALTLAEPEGYVRVFVDEGEAMRDLLRRATSRGTAGSHARRLLAAFDEPAQPVSTASQAAADLAEPLTAREVEILRLVAAGMRNQQIADQLFISLATVKRHIANCYGKLGVSHRTAAVARANELKVL
ncbi:MAG TPA: LuxR C-terminal-related transcriptional regulator [Thermomicrobiales bacterium]|nr:LuxR C-terminal-related transcriptional regulator [Thermomicrobiales bacterium]